jgi:hypothetical protein
VNQPAKHARSNEFIAVPLVFFLLGAVFLVLGAAHKGIWAWIVAGALILFGIAYGARAWRQSGLGEAGDPPDVASRQDLTSYNVLVLADDLVPENELRRVVEAHAAGRPVTAYVVAPQKSSGLDRLTGDQAAYEKAQEHLESTLQALDGLTAGRQGKVGPHDPVQAIEEALREFPAEEILVPAQSDSSREAEAKFGVPVAALTA